MPDEKVTGQELDDAMAVKVMGWSCELDFHPSASLEDAKKAEDRIAELGLEHEYAGALLEATGTQYQSSLPVVVWAVIRATPEERCLAALSVMEKSK